MPRLAIDTSDLLGGPRPARYRIVMKPQPFGTAAAAVVLADPLTGSVADDGTARIDGLIASPAGTYYSAEFSDRNAGTLAEVLFVMPDHDADLGTLAAQFAPPAAHAATGPPGPQGFQGIYDVTAYIRAATQPADPAATQYSVSDGRAMVALPEGASLTVPDGTATLWLSHSQPVNPAAGDGLHRLLWSEWIEDSGTGRRGPTGPAGPPGRDGTVDGIGVDAVVWEHVAAFDTDITLPAAAEPSWTHLLWSDAVDGGIRHDWNFWTVLEGSLHIDVDTTDTYQFTMRTRHDFGAAGAILSERKIERRVTRSEIVAVPFILFDSISKIPLGLFSGVDITEALLAAPSTISQEIVVTRVGGGTFKLDSAAIDDGSEAHFIQFGAVKGDKGDQGNDAEVAEWARIDSEATIPLAKTDPGLRKEIDNASQAVSNIEADHWVVRHRIGSAAVDRPQLSAAVNDLLSDADAASDSIIRISKALQIINEDGWVTARRIARASVDVDAIKAEGTPDATTYLRGDGEWQTPPGGSGDTTPLSDADPQPPGPAAAGAGTAASRDSHVHPRQTAVTGAEIARATVASQNLTELLQADLKRIPAPGQPSKVWATDSDSSPAWRDLPDPTPTPTAVTAPESFELESAVVAAQGAATDATIKTGTTVGPIITAITSAQFTVAAGRYLVVCATAEPVIATGVYRAFPTFVLYDTDDTEIAMWGTSTYYRSDLGENPFVSIGYLELDKPATFFPQWIQQQYDAAQSVGGAITIPSATVTLQPQGAGPAGKDGKPGPAGPDARSIHSTNTIYVNPPGDDNAPAQPQLYAPPQIGGLWINDGSEEHTGARPIAKAARAVELVSDDTRVLTHRYGYSFTEADGTYTVDETASRIEGFGAVTRGTGARDNTPELIWDNDSSNRNFNQRNIAATNQNWGSTTLTNHAVVTVPLEGPGWVEGIELECRALRGSVAALDIPTNGLVRTHNFPDSSHPRPRVVQFVFDITNNQLAGDHQQKLWFDLAINGAHADLRRGPVTIEFSSPFLGSVPVVSGGYTTSTPWHLSPGNDERLLTGFPAATNAAASYLRQVNYFEPDGNRTIDRGIAFFEATEDIFKLVLNCYSKPPDDEVATSNQGTLRLWTELDGEISRHVVTSRRCEANARYNLYATIDDVVAGQRFWWSYVSDTLIGAVGNIGQIGNPQADWDANRAEGVTPEPQVIVPGLRKSVELLAAPETGSSSQQRTLIAADSRPVAIQRWEGITFVVRASSSVNSWTDAWIPSVSRWNAQNVFPVRIGNTATQGQDPSYLWLDAAGNLQLDGFGGRLVSVVLWHW